MTVGIRSTTLACISLVFILVWALLSGSASLGDVLNLSLSNEEAAAAIIFVLYYSLLYALDRNAEAILEGR